MEFKNIIKDYLESNKFLHSDLSKEILKHAKNSKHFCMFGAGTYGAYAIPYLEKLGLKPDFVCDNNKELWGTKVFYEFDCKPPSVIDEHTFVLIASVFCKEIGEQLNEMGIKNVLVYTKVREDINGFLDKKLLIENIVNHVDIYEDELSAKSLFAYIKNVFTLTPSGPGFDDVYVDNQYWPYTEGDLSLSPNEYFVDCGAFTGDTLLSFIERTNGKFSEISLFEMDSVNYKCLVETINGLDSNLQNKITPYNLGVWNESSVMKFNSHPSRGASSLDAKSDLGDEVKTIRLDDIFENKKVTLVKMDIEGAELNALKGLENTIKKQSPKLAICAYHKIQDLWELYDYIKSLNPEYKFYLRQHTPVEHELVLYAVSGLSL